MGTKERILTTAVDLFNQTSVAEVSTNHIAKAASISPGNLYYHYPNKEAIVRAALERMIEAFDKVWTLPEERRVTLTDLRNTLAAVFDVLWRYRFFYREQVALLRRDPELAARHKEIQAQRVAEQEAYFGRFVTDGVLVTPADPTHLRTLITAGWVIANNWLTFVEASGERVEPGQLRRGTDLILRVLEPYLSADAKTHLNQGVTYDSSEIHPDRPEA